jgi:hypothetical protein
MAAKPQARELAQARLEGLASPASLPTGTPLGPRQHGAGQLSVRGRIQGYSASTRRAARCSGRAQQRFLPVCGGRWSGEGFGL